MKKLPPRRVTLEQGVTVTLRPIKSRDLDGIWANFNEVVEEGTFIPVLSPVLTDYEKTGWHEDLKLRNDICTVAEYPPAPDHPIVAQCTIQNVEWETASHVADLGIIVRKGYRDRGLGYALIQYSIEMARLNYKKKLNLAVFATNHRAIALYKKLGFKQVGYRENQYKYKRREYIDEILMDLWIGEPP